MSPVCHIYISPVCTLLEKNNESKEIRSPQVFSSQKIRSLEDHPFFPFHPFILFSILFSLYCKSTVLYCKSFKVEDDKMEGWGVRGEGWSDVRTGRCNAM